MRRESTTCLKHIGTDGIRKCPSSELSRATPVNPDIFARLWCPRHTAGSAAYHGWLARHPWRVVAAATLVFIVMAALAWRLKLRTAFTELLPSNDPGVVALTRTQKRMGDLSLLLIGIRSPDYQANLRYAEALTQKLRAQPPTVVNLATYHVRDVRDFFERNKWLYVSEDGPRSDPRPAAQRDQQAQEPAVRVAGRGRVDRCDAGAAVGQERPRRPLPGRRVHQQGGRIRLDRGAAAGRAVRRERRRGAVATRPIS